MIKQDPIAVELEAVVALGHVADDQDRHAIVARAEHRGADLDIAQKAFQRKRFWLSDKHSQTGDVAGLGLGGTGHALLGAVVEMPESGGLVLTGLAL